MIPDADHDPWAEQAFAELTAAAPGAAPVLVRHLAHKVAAARSAHGEDAGKRELQIVEKFLRSAVRLG
jgi:hypothetical protein